MCSALNSPSGLGRQALSKQVCRRVQRLRLTQTVTIVQTTHLLSWKTILHKENAGEIFFPWFCFNLLDSQCRGMYPTLLRLNRSSNTSEEIVYRVFCVWSISNLTITSSDTECEYCRRVLYEESITYKELPQVLSLEYWHWGHSR